MLPRALTQVLGPDRTIPAMKRIRQRLTTGGVGENGRAVRRSVKEEEVERLGVRKKFENTFSKEGKGQKTAS